VENLTRRVGVALHRRAVSDTAPDSDLASARERLDELFSEIVAALRHTEPPPASTPVVVLLSLLSEIKLREVLDEQVHHGRRSFRLVREGLAALRGASTTPALVDIAPAIVCSLGFDRAIVSRVVDSTWIPEKVHVADAAMWAEELLAVGRAQPQLLNSALVETEMVRRRVPILVHHVQGNPDVHRASADSRSYVAAPLTLDGKVVGFLHADCYYEQRLLTAADRQALAMFADGMSQALARTIALDQVEELRAGLDRMSHAMATTAMTWPAFGQASEQIPGPGLDPATGADAVPPHLALTRREIEVLRLMAAGETNGRIAQRLVITEGTAKSHVKHILRKLGAVNRADAVSQWLQTGPEAGMG
jgi:DNA-binding CsgD family transcriptional regulator/GAF domain-containing protein